MNCWNCKTELIWGSDFDLDHENESYSMMTALHCPNCECDVEVYYPKENETMTEYRPFIEWCQRVGDKKHLMQHISALLDEIDFLREQLQPHDTGHIHTAIGVLESRVDKLWESMKT